MKLSSHILRDVLLGKSPKQVAMTTALLATAVALVGGAIPAHAAPAQAAGATLIPKGVIVDPTFDFDQPAVTVGEIDGAARASCPDRAFTAVVTMSTSVPGCNVIGTTPSTTVTYGWYKHTGNANPCIWGKGFNSKAQPTWPELSCGTGRTKAVAWGNVAATKQIRGLTSIGWAGVQWS